MNNQNDDSIKEIKETGASLTDGKENKKRKADCVYVSTQHEEATNLAKAVNIPSEEDVMMVLDMENNHFLKMFEALKDYKRIHGDCIVPLTHPANPDLARWCLELRDNRRWFYQGKSSTLDVEKLKLLDQLGFVWDDVRWLDMYVRLKKFKAESGHVLVPNRYQKDKQLGQWVSKQRQRYRVMRQDLLQGRPINTSKITPERVKMLEDLGMVWDARPLDKVSAMNQKNLNSASGANEASVSIHLRNSNNFQVIRPSYNEQWNLMFGRLLKYKSKHNHMMVPNRCKEDPPLGQWVSRQRAYYKLLKQGKKSSTMTQERIQKLEEAGFVWDGRGSRNNLRAFHGRGPPALEEVAVAAGIGGQVLNDQLQSCYVTYDQQWLTMFERLLQFKAQFGHCLVPNRYEHDRQLGQWVSRQRRHYRLLQENKNSNMTPERIHQLENIGFVWSAREADNAAIADPAIIKEVNELRNVVEMAGAAINGDPDLVNNESNNVSADVNLCLPLSESPTEGDRKEDVGEVVIEETEFQQLSPVLENDDIIESPAIKVVEDVSGDDLDDNDSNKQERWRLLLDAAVKV